jgi:hypothetical protein
MRKHLLAFLCLIVTVPALAQSTPSATYCNPAIPSYVYNNHFYICANGSPVQVDVSSGTYLPLSGGVLTGPLYTAPEFSNGTCTTAATITPAHGNRQKITLTNGDTCALTFTQPSSGTVSITLKVVQSSTSTFNGGISGCKWPGGTVPTITATSAAVDFVSIYLDGTNSYCVASQNFQ